VLRANLWLPSEHPGKVPTVLTVTGYNNDATDPAGQSALYRIESYSTSAVFKARRPDPADVRHGQHAGDDDTAAGARERAGRGDPRARGGAYGSHVLLPVAPA
jgi:hypothetical protein